MCGVERERNGELVNQGGPAQGLCAELRGRGMESLMFAVLVTPRPQRK